MTILLAIILYLVGFYLLAKRTVPNLPPRAIG